MGRKLTKNEIREGTRKLLIDLNIVDEPLTENIPTVNEKENEELTFIGKDFLLILPNPADFQELDEALKEGKIVFQDFRVEYPEIITDPDRLYEILKLVLNEYRTTLKILNTIVKEHLAKLR